MYDYLIVGAGLCGAVFAQRKTEQGKSAWSLKGVIISLEIEPQNLEDQALKLVGRDLARVIQIRQ